MASEIFPITQDLLRDEVLCNLLYPDLRHTLYWSKDWDPDFYVELARAGFISISHTHPEWGALLLPELQSAYAVLDWPDLKYSRRIRRLLRSGRIERDQIELRVESSLGRVLERLVDYHQPHSWLCAPYREMLMQIPAAGHGGFALHGIEIWSRRENQLVAGELGYSIGQTYTSLSGFSTRNDRRWHDFGTLQMVLLAERLQQQGYVFWNLGHPHQAYKHALGAKVVERGAFLERWLAARDQPPDRPLAQANDDRGASHTPRRPRSSLATPERDGRRRAGAAEEAPE